VIWKEYAGSAHAYELDGTDGSGKLSASQRTEPDGVFRFRPTLVRVSQLSLSLPSSRTNSAPVMVTCSSDARLSMGAPATRATTPRARPAKIWERILKLGVKMG